ncbi:hypothetical protein R5W23_003872 [Gemmata sp. JC673]|uniref:ATP-binding protein n=1 Tax=Gemmata algarum TaxID=2975278 RepID=A0ABU5F988_9BACT|nr:hypothetical protein [Gemmata algarum]MDY3562406.1 hypothetical protein [Gemmata algarum]
MSLTNTQRSELAKALPKYFTTQELRAVALSWRDLHFTTTVNWDRTIQQVALDLVEAVGRFAAWEWFFLELRRLNPNTELHTRLRTLGNGIRVANTGEGVPRSASAQTPAPSPRPGPLDHVHLGGSEYFLDRQGFRVALRELTLSTGGRRLLVVNGPKASGKSHSRRFIAYLRHQDWSGWHGAPWRKKVRFAVFSPREQDFHGLTPQDVWTAIASDLQLREREAPPQPPDQTVNAWVPILCKSLADQIRDQKAPAWIVLDGFREGRAAPEVIDFVIQFAIRVVTNLDSVRLILLDFPSVLPGAVRLLTHPEDVVPPSSGEIAQDLRQLGYELSSEQIDQLLIRITAAAGGGAIQYDGFWRALTSFLSRLQGRLLAPNSGAN